MVRSIFFLALTAGLAGCATHEGRGECRPEGRIAYPANWDDDTPPVPELAGINWLALGEKDDRYLLEDGRVFIDTVPVRPPVPRYPEGGGYINRQSECEVKFSVGTDGRPSNIRTACSDPLFNFAAETAARSARFTPATLDSRPVVRNHVVYPLSFCGPR